MFTSVRHSAFRLWLYLTKFRRMSMYKKSAALTIPRVQFPSDIEEAQPREIARLIPSHHVPHAYGIISYSFTSLPTNDDARSIAEIRLAPQTTIAALHEGHGEDGRSVAGYICSNLNHRVCANTVGRKTIIDRDTIREAFKQVEDGLMQETTSERISWSSGSTSAIVYVKGNEVIVANLGDTVVFVGRPKFWNWRVPTEVVSEDHSVENITEREALLAKLSGIDDGAVTYTPNAGWSVKGKTQLTRGFGHSNLKVDQLSQFHLTVPILGTEPHIKVIQRQVNDKFYVLASKSVLNYFTPEDIGHIIVNRLAQREEIAKWLVEATLHEANLHGTEILTDIAVLVVFIDGEEAVPPQAQRHASNYGQHLDDCAILD